MIAKPSKMSPQPRPILPSSSSSWRMLFMTLILLQYHIQSVVAYPVIPSAFPGQALSTPDIITRSASSLRLLARDALTSTTSTLIHPRSAALSKRGVFSSESGLAIGTAIIVAVGVLIGLGVGLIAVCGFPWKGWCTRSHPKEGKEKNIAVDEISRMMVDDTAARTPVPSASPRPSSADLMTPAIPSTPLRYPGQYHGRGESRGYETDEDQLNFRQEARPTGYV